MFSNNLARGAFGGYSKSNSVSHQINEFLMDLDSQRGAQHTTRQQKVLSLYNNKPVKGPK